MLVFKLGMILKHIFACICNPGPRACPMVGSKVSIKHIFEIEIKVFLGFFFKPALDLISIT